ncbi:MAG TPA: methylated-DNA--[protein]-cysteine S-methyltransferase [Thermoanaerobaculia bacterium]
MRKKPDSRARRTDTHGRIYSVISRIPRGRVATYGQIARLAGMPGQARLVGYALSALPDCLPVPWHRVVNARGEVSARSGGGGGMEVVQRLLLKRECVRFGPRNRIRLEIYRWRPRA